MDSPAAKTVSKRSAEPDPKRSRGARPYVGGSGGGGFGRRAGKSFLSSPKAAKPLSGGMLASGSSREF